MRHLELILDKINQLITLIGGAAIALMMIHITLDIIFRFFLNSPLPGTITIVAHYYMIIAIFLPLAYTEQVKASISVEILTNIFPKKIQKLFEKVSYFFITIISYLITYVSFGVAMKNFHSKTSVMQGDYTIATWPSYFILCFGVFLLGTYTLVKLLTFSKIDDNKNKVEAMGQANE